LCNGAARPAPTRPVRVRVLASLPSASRDRVAQRQSACTTGRRPEVRVLPRSPRAAAGWKLSPAEQAALNRKVPGSIPGHPITEGQADGRRRQRSRKPPSARAPWEFDPLSFRLLMPRSFNGRTPRCLRGDDGSSSVTGRSIARAIDGPQAPQTPASRSGVAQSGERLAVNQRLRRFESCPRSSRERGRRLPAGLICRFPPGSTPGLPTSRLHRLTAGRQALNLETGVRLSVELSLHPHPER
jgi:hypothetical protein